MSLKTALFAQKKLENEKRALYSTDSRRCSAKELKDKRRGSDNRPQMMWKDMDGFERRRQRHLSARP